jgi:hypothetical protein
VSLGSGFDHVATGSPPGGAVLVNATSPQNTLGGVLVGPPALVPLTFSVRRGYEGPQVIIEWGEPYDPPSVLSVSLVRRLFGFPTGPTDGVVVFTGGPVDTIVSDVDVEPCRCYYYKLFVTAQNGDVVVSLSTQGDVIPLESGYYAAKLWDLIPELYKTQDKGLDEPESIRRALVEGTDGITPEVFNIGQDGSVQRGPLQRLFHLIGPLLDEAKGLIDCMIHQIEVDEACIPQLEGLAALLGLKLNKELTPERMRSEVHNQVPWLKIKGTIPSVESRITAVSGLVPQVHEQCEDVLYTNDLTRTTPAFTLSEIAALGSIDDELYYTIGYDDRPPFWLWYTVYVTLTAGYVLDLPTLRKWCAAIEESSPSCHRGFLTIDTFGIDADTMPIALNDVSDGDEIEDGMDDTFPVVFAEATSDSQIADPSLWLIISNPARLLNAPNWTAVFAAPSY